MKKITSGLSLLFAGLTTNSFAGLHSDWCNVQVPRFCSGFTFTLAGLYLKPNLTHTDYALSFSNNDTSFINGEFHNVKEPYNWGYRVAIGYLFQNTGNDVMLSFTHYDKSDTDRVKATKETQLLPTLTTLPTGNITTPPVSVTAVTFVPGGFIVPPPTIPFVAIPATELTFDFQLTSAKARAEFKQDVVDLDFGQHVNIGCNGKFRWFGGLRYANLQHKLNASYEASGQEMASLEGDQITLFGFAPSEGVLSTAISLINVDISVDITSTLQKNVTAKSNFQGAGPRFGLDACYDLGCGFGIIGSSSASLIVGTIESSLTDQTRINTLGTVTNTTTNITAIPEIPPLITAATIDVSPGDEFSNSSVIEESTKYHNKLRVVPSFDAKLGLNYTYQFKCNPQKKLTIEAGYIVFQYLNSVDLLSSLDMSRPELRTRNTLDMSFAGPYVGIQLNI
jgi:hypothetical protein